MKHMMRIFVIGCGMLLSASAVLAAPPAAPATQPAYPLWDGKETLAQYAQRAAIKSPETKLDLGKGVALKLALIPAGKFLMGIAKDELALFPAEAKQEGFNGSFDISAESPQHEVTISTPFYFGVYVVTQDEYQQIVGKNPSKFIGARNPVEQIAYDAAQEFCQKASAKTARTVRLPTEAEWEYACRAGTTTPFNLGATITPDQANYWGTYAWNNGKKGVYRNKTTPVGTFKPNAWGLYDMHGNAAQWCSDWFGKDYYSKSPAADPTGPATGERRVMRGGGFGYSPMMCRSAFRDRLMPEWHWASMGFRVVVELSK